MSACWKHFKTVCKHKWYVYRECAACGIRMQGVMHDISKFSPVEFVSSARYFQGDKSPIEAEKESVGYSVAWLHHKGHNPHHWEYWTDFGFDGAVIANEIPYKYVVEMVCDWIGAGKVYGNGNWTEKEPLEYFKRVRSGRHFHPRTEILIIRMLTCIAGYGLDKFHKLARLKSAAVWCEPKEG